MKCYTWTISQLRDLYKLRQLELNPPYQRRSVWKTKQRKLLVESVFNGVPIPALIVHKRYDKKRNKYVYDILDGKQRVETILHFIELIDIENEGDWEISLKNKSNQEKIIFSYSDLRKISFNKKNNNIAERFWKRELPVIEYDGEIFDFYGDILPAKEIFVRINSTGSSLKKNEIRHASHNVLFFKLGEELENRYKKLFVASWKIFTDSDVSRFIFHEFILELCTALFFERFTDKRSKLEELLVNHEWTIKEIQRIRSRFSLLIKWVKDILPEQYFSKTRFKNKSDFYSLFVVLNDFVNNGYITINKKDNRILGNTLLDFSKAVQLASLELKSYDIEGKYRKYDKELLRYIISTRQATDSLNNRQIRHDYLKSILKGFVLKKSDKKRVFSKDVKSILWLTILKRTKNPQCPNPLGNEKCKMDLIFTDAQVDHIHPWSKGGSTSFGNAQLICSSCNRHKSNH